MSDLRLDDCSHCACVTYLHLYTREKAIQALESGDLGCRNCLEDDDGHGSCVVLYDGDEAIWDGRCDRPSEGEEVVAVHPTD